VKKIIKWPMVALLNKTITCARAVNKNETCLVICVCRHACLILMGLFVKEIACKQYTKQVIDNIYL